MKALDVLVPARAVELPERHQFTRDELAEWVRDELTRTGWRPPLPETDAELQVIADELSDHLDLDGEDRYTAATIRDWRAVYEPVDDDEAREWLAKSIVSDVVERLSYPNRHNWRRWSATRWLSMRLYTLGVTSSGGGSTSCGADPFRTWVHDLPRWQSFRPGPRPYLLGLSREARTCLRLIVSGHARPHRPGRHDVWGICGVCSPWPCCGSTTFDHAEGCEGDR